MDETVSGTTAFFMALQFLNALVSIFSTPDGRIASGKDSQPENAEFPIVVRVDGKLMAVNFLQPEKVSDGISFKLLANALLSGLYSFENTVSDKI